MNVKKVTNFLSKPAILAPTVFLAVGTGKTFLDYEKAKTEKKKRTLVKDAAMLSGAAAGFMLQNSLSRKICKSTPVNNSLLKNTRYIVLQSAAAVFNTFGGILGAICGNKLAYKFVLNKPYFNNQPADDVSKQNESNDIFRNLFFTESGVFNKFNYINKPVKQTAGAILSLPNMSYFSAPMAALTGMSVAKAEGYNKQMKMTAKELIANCLVPTILVSVVSILVHNKKNYIKYPALFAGLIAGSYAGNKLAEKYQDKLYETIDSINFEGINFKKSKESSESEG